MTDESFPRRILRRWWRAVLADQGVAEEVRDDDTGLSDGLILAAIVSLVIALSQSRNWEAWALSIPVGLASTALLGLVLAITTRWVKSETTWWEATTVVSITMLPLLLSAIPVVGVFIGALGWLLGSILMLRHISYVSVNNAAIAVLTAVAMVAIITLGITFAITAAI